MWSPAAQMGVDALSTLTVHEGPSAHSTPGAAPWLPAVVLHECVSRHMPCMLPSLLLYLTEILESICGVICLAQVF